MFKMNIKENMPFLREKKILLFILLFVGSTILATILSITTIYFEARDTLEHLLKSEVEQEKQHIKTIQNETLDIEKTLRIVETINLKEKGQDHIEIVIGRRLNDSIELLSTWRSRNKTLRIAYQSDLSIPMKLALTEQKAGFIKGKDYQGEKVYAAYGYLEELGWGIVAKTPVQFIIQPYHNALAISIILSTILVSVCVYFFLRLVNSYINNIKEKESNFNEIFNESTDCIFICDLTGNVLEVNLEGCNTLKYSRHEIIKLNINTLYPKQKLRHYKELQKQLLEKNEISYEIELVAKNKGIIPMDVKAKIFKYKNKLAIINVARNITERKKFEEQIIENQNKLILRNKEFQLLNEQYLNINEQLNHKNEMLMLALKKAEDSDRLKSAFLSNISHEIRTPMNIILGFSKLLLKPNLEIPKQNDFANHILVNSNQLLSIIDDLICLSKIDSNNIELNTKEFNLNVLLFELYEKLYEKAQKGNNNFVYSNALNDNDSNIITDYIHLQKILSNLVGNALKFTKNGQVSFGYTTDGKELLFFIKDSGIGIAPEYLEMIFDRFRQVETGFTRYYGGTGLGLSITKSLVELLGGRIWVESDLNIGSTFYFTIPYKQSFN